MSAPWVVGNRTERGGEVFVNFDRPCFEERDGLRVPTPGTFVLTAEIAELLEIRLRNTLLWL